MTMIRARRLPAPALLVLCFLTLLAPPAAAAGAQDHGHPEGDPFTLGDVDFPVSCTPAAAARFETAVAALHSFWFEAAERGFQEVAAADPSCAMAHWGLAMTYLGNPMARVAPGAERMALGRAAAERARALAGAASHREQMYADAVVAYYEDEARDHATRSGDHERAMGALHGAHPDDMEAAIFYARAVVANAPPSDLTFSRQILGAELMQPLFEGHPNHPGLAHYLIHAYDAPALAARGEKAAFAYADIAPSAPHALHMPSHIFTRLGYWDASIETNARSAQAEPVPDAAVHPMDYMVYAYLQQGRDGEAKRIVQRAVENSDRFYGGIMGYNFAAMPARFALERGDWAAAAAQRVPTGAPAFVEAIPRFARAIGAARAGRLGDAREETAALGRLHTVLVEQGDAYWATLVKAQRLAAESWAAHLAGNDASALLLAREAAELEETVEKHPVTPGPLLPARELQGDLLMELGRHAEALEAYAATLEREPRRARALYGAARAAELAGRPVEARGHYEALLEVMAGADDTRAEPKAARRFLGKG
ncbi:MAG TPA: bacterial transcriptional activator domain-containing protein [Longimicrobiales bacterium]|nr:bacterial transcriptional activator domain-containing protein [Longimicrobiales bacterium]